MQRTRWRPLQLTRDFMDSAAAGGLARTAAAALALVVANSPLGPGSFTMLRGYVGPLCVEHWVNAGLVAVFFPLVGIQVKREALAGRTRSFASARTPDEPLDGEPAPALVHPRAWNGR